MNTNRKNAFNFILLLFSLAVTGQKIVSTISGQILDKETAEPIAFASIYLKGKAIGTISNEEGYCFSYPLWSKRDSNRHIRYGLWHLCSATQVSIALSFDPNLKVKMTSSR